MTDTLSPKERSDRMRLIKSRNTSTEIVVRRMVHRLGYRYRLHVRALAGTPDLVFAKRKVAMFVHGCFWHQHSSPACKLARMPKSRLEFWKTKLAGNRSRDTKQEQTLVSQGWKVAVIWECETKNTHVLESAIRNALEEI